MGSRVRSAMTAPGAVTESDFQKVFAETKPIQVHSVRDLTDRLEDLTKNLTNPNGDWKKKTALLATLRGLLISDFPNIQNLMVENSSLWERGLVDGMKELRSSLCKEYCITVAFFAQKLGVRFFKQVSLLFDGLITLVQNSAKIMASAAYIATEYVAKYVQHHRLINMLAGYISSKSVAIRRDAVHLSEIILSQWDPEYLESQNLVKILMEIVKSGCCDADIQCRQMGREAYFILAEKYPDPARIVYESLDPQRQKMINDSRSAASSSRSIMHERGDLPMVSSLKAQQSQFLANRSRSDVHFRANPRITPSRNIAPSSKDSDSGMTPFRGNVKKELTSVLPKATGSVPRPASAFRKPMLTKPRLAAPSSAPVNGNATITARPFGVFGPTKPTPPVPRASSALPKPLATKIRPVLPPASLMNGTTTTVNNSGRSLLTDIFDEIRFDFQKIKEDASQMDTYSKALNDTLIKYQEYINEGKLLPENFNEEQMKEFSTKFKAIIALLVTIFKDTTFPSQLRITALESVKKTIDDNPARIQDNHELLIMRILECQERNDALLCRAAEDCGTSVIKPLSIERCKELIMPLILDSDVKPYIIAAALKLISRKFETLDATTVESILLETKDTILKLYGHTEAVVRRGTVIYFVAVASVLGLDRLRPHLPVQMMRMVTVYYEKIMKSQELGL